jgi:hypothetical protein
LRSVERDKRRGDEPSYEKRYSDKNGGTFYDAYSK